MAEVRYIKLRGCREDVWKRQRFTCRWLEDEKHVLVGCLRSKNWSINLKFKEWLI
jgi:hypothetical protein